MERLRQEITSVLADKSELKREDLKKMNYLSNILKESMFMYLKKPQLPHTWQNMADFSI